MACIRLWVEVFMISAQEKVCATCKRVFKEEKDFFKDTAQWRLCNAGNLWFNCKCGSTLMLPKGKFPWYSPTLQLSDAASIVFNRIAKENKIPYLPTAILQIQEKLANPDIDIKDLALAVRQEPLIAAEMVKMAENLKSFRSGDKIPIKSIEHAITYIGRKSLQDLVITSSLKAIKLTTKSFKAEEFWEQSFLTASIAENLAVKFQQQNQKDKIYLAACLCNIGKILLAYFFPDDMDKIYDHVNGLKTMTTWEHAEEQLGVLSHCILGEIASAFWGLPHFVMDVARYHHKDAQPIAAVGKSEIVDIVAFANAFAHWVLLEPHRIDEEKFKSFVKFYNLSDKEVEELGSMYKKQYDLQRTQ